jgi:hypothetical protein
VGKKGIETQESVIITLGVKDLPIQSKDTVGQVLVAHICNPSYSGGRAQENHSLKPAPANSSRDTISKEKKKTHKQKQHKKGLVEWLKW